ncbi:unnamed protein product [Toxocara canis]|uniref:Spindle-and centromere-associated protein n=1 Tax=Toxocara canis TaxID=6265 RepID=A0A183VA62_TOXCA|nr:unnamed protein product [Toxocara canis]
MESATAEGDVTTHIVRTLVRRADYGTSGGDSTLHIGDVVSTDNTAYGVSDSFSADVVLSSEIYGTTSTTYSAAGLDHDLSSFKKRIDANTEEQREHADLMVELQRKVEEYRRRIADIERQIATHKADERVTFDIKESTETWEPGMTVVSGDFTISAQLEEERRRNEEQRLQIVQLQAEIQRLQQRFQMEMQDKERISQNRERNLAQYLSEEQKKMMDLWAELQQVRRQFDDYKEQTARELEHHRNEFARVTHDVGGVVRRLSISTIAVTVVVKNMRAGQVQCRYEEAIERIVELETLRGGSVGTNANLETEFRRTRERLAECQGVLHKVLNVTKEYGSNLDVTKRARSASPVGHVVPSEVLREVRNVMRVRSNEVQQLQRKMKNAELEISELVARVESCETTRKRMEKLLTDAKKDINIQQKAVEDANREVRRLEDRLRASESERTVVETARAKLEEEIRRLRILIDQTSSDAERKALEEFEAQKRIIEEEHKRHSAELMRRIDVLQDENRRLKGDMNSVKDKYRNLEIDFNNTLLKLDEKGNHSVISICTLNNIIWLEMIGNLLIYVTTNFAAV